MSKLNNWFINNRIITNLIDSIYDDEYFPNPVIFRSGRGIGWGCTYDTHISDDYEILPENYNENGYANGCGHGYGIGEYSGSVCGDSD